MKNTILIFVLIINGLCFSQTPIIEDSIDKKKNETKETPVTKGSTFKESNKLVHSGSISIGKENETSNWELFIPSFIAVLVALLALGGTLWNGSKQRDLLKDQLKEQQKNAQQSLTQQIQASKDTLEQQINSAKRIAEKQIDSSNSVAQLNFRQNVLSTNRQNWINSLRDNVSQVIADIDSCSLSNTITKDEYKKINSLLVKIELMVNPKEDTEFIQSIKGLNLMMSRIFVGKNKYSDLSEPKEKVKSLVKIILKTEWERVKKGK